MRGEGCNCVLRLTRYCGVEINREYCYWTVKRLMNAIDNNTIQGYEDGVFWERNSLGDQKKATNTI